MARANAIVNQLYVVNPNYGGAVRDGSERHRRPGGDRARDGRQRRGAADARSSTSTGSSQVREYGTAGLSPHVEAAARRATAGVPGLSRWLRRR